MFESRSNRYGVGRGKELTQASFLSQTTANKCILQRTVLHSSWISFGIDVIVNLSIIVKAYIFDFDRSDTTNHDIQC